MAVKRLKCSECGFVNATNKMNDDRFYCSKCGRNLGSYEVTLNNCKER